MKRHVRLQSQFDRKCRHGAVHRVFANQIEMDVDTVRHEVPDCAKQRALIFHGVLTRDIK